MHYHTNTHTKTRACVLPGNIDIVLTALKTRNVRKACVALVPEVFESMSVVFITMDGILQNNNNNQCIFKAQNLVPRDYSKCIHMHAHTNRGTCTHRHSDYAQLNIHSLKRAANARATWNG